MDLLVLDVVTNYEDVDLSSYAACEILALTPTSFYCCDVAGRTYKTFHDIVPVAEFNASLLQSYEEHRRENEQVRYYEAFIDRIVKEVSYFRYCFEIIRFIREGRYDAVHLITDREFSDAISLENTKALWYKSISFTTTTVLARKYSHFAKKAKRSIVWTKIIRKVASILHTRSLVRYDWTYIVKKPKLFTVQTQTHRVQISMKNEFGELITRIYEHGAKQISISRFFIFLSTSDAYFGALYLRQKRRLYFYQHGAYLYRNILLRDLEVSLADVNFVFNDYTKALFETLGAKEVHSVGSLLFSKPIRQKKKRFDYLYITQGHDYVGNFQYVDFPNALHSFDGYGLYKRHLAVIRLFGERLRDQTVCVRAHPAVIGLGLYVPLWEVARNYTNVTIDAARPIERLIEESTYIMSDYFTSEFINREIHYKKTIILFQGAPTPLPSDVVSDMQKMFLLVDSVEELEEIINHIDEYVKDRRQDDAVIEYYTCKKSDTYAVVKKILDSQDEVKNGMRVASKKHLIARNT